jgi:predicted nucleic acid-binding protein
VRYRDASASVPLVVAEEATDVMRGLLAEDPHVATWPWTSVSAVERRARGGELTREQRRAALARFAVLAEGWDEVTDVLPVRRRALGARPAPAARG